MKTLYLLRHAKSDWDRPVADFDRPLNERGRKAAPRIGAVLRERPIDLVLASPARRVAETVAGVEQGLGRALPVRIVEDIYGAGATALLRLVQSCGEDTARLMVVGHNPGLGALASLLAADGEPAALANLRHKYPTGALAIIQFDGDSWSEVVEDSGRLTAFVRPRDLG